MSIFFLETQKTKPGVGILDVQKKEIMVSFHKIKILKKKEQKNRDVYLQQGERQKNTWYRRQHTKKKKSDKDVTRRQEMLKASTQIQGRRDGQKQREEVIRQDSILGMHTRRTIGEFEPVYPSFSQPKPGLHYNR